MFHLLEIKKKLLSKFLWIHFNLVSQKHGSFLIIAYNIFQLFSISLSLFYGCIPISGRYFPVYSKLLLSIIARFISSCVQTIIKCVVFLIFFNFPILFRNLEMFSLVFLVSFTVFPMSCNQPFLSDQINDQLNLRIIFL